MLLLGFLIPNLAVAKSAEPYAQDFVITAYYSPLPNQCCYVKGSYEADVELNGNGTNGASGTPVYPGMLAAPAEYPFGTVILLPGIGTLKVTDRGGAIKVTDAGVHRLDVWAGAGEEGLARALAFGVQRIRGTVYPLGSDQPKELVDLGALPSPVSLLQSYMTDQVNLLSMDAKVGDRSPAVRLLQQNLQDVGYFPRSITGLFGDDTKKSLVAFQKDFGIDESGDQLTENTAAMLQAAQERLKAKPPLDVFVERGSSADDIMAAQRTLRFLSYYHGRTDGLYDDKLFQAIVAFQKDHQLIGSEASVGAGRIGPLTQKKIFILWNSKIVAARAAQILMLHHIDQLIAQKNMSIQTFLVEGDHSEQVKRLQTMLADRGYFPKSRVSGLFGDVTRQAVLAFQKAVGIVKNDTDKGAGNVGPATLSFLHQDLRSQLYNLVRAKGWDAL